MVAALRGRDSSYIPMGSLDGYANFNSLIGSRPLPGPRLNSFNGFGLHGFVPSGTSQLGCTLNNTNNSINDVGKLQGNGLPTLQGNQQGTLIQGRQQPNAMQEANSSLLGCFSSSGLAIGNSSNISFTNSAKTAHMLNNQQQTQSAGLSNQSSVRMQPPLSSSDRFQIGASVSSHSADFGRCNKTWQGAVSSSTYHESTMSLPFDNNIRSNISPMASNLGSSDGLGNLQNQASPLLTTTGVNGDANLFNIRSSGNSNLKWDDPERGHTQNGNPADNTSPSSLVSNIHITDQNAGNQKLVNVFSNKKLDMPIMSLTSFGDPLVAQDSRFVSQLHYKDEHLFEDTKLPSGISSGDFGLDDLVANAMVKPGVMISPSLMTILDVAIFYSLGACV